MSEREQIERKAEDVLDIIQSVASNYLQVELSGSIGISIFPDDGNDLDKLYEKADEALYKAKRNGKNKFVLE